MSSRCTPKIDVVSLDTMDSLNIFLATYNDYLEQIYEKLFLYQTPVEKNLRF